MSWLCTGSRVVADRDPRPPLSEGYVHTCRVKLTEDGGRSPPGVVGGCVLTGEMRKGTNEPVRFLNDALKPKLCYAYDRYNDMYLCIPT